ncbi:DUF3489 domain-containing protein [Phenylobacterium sp. 20VBR1]|uniref:DUF3489 domain-containing protein n=1 Tax=Phenylobacterium glaciei TaxID=2803784 RepID=A0A941CY46_9CAUL|nr:DUF3489 domain-containing protein [Phenylobacterium glaciei]MBR7618786.1 DUF3489 domain-containing protein [Phenylobacterium glaciei]
MTKFTRIQAQLLTQAAATEGFIPPADTAQTTITSLIRRGMLISLPGADGPSRLIITQAARAAIGGAAAQSANADADEPATVPIVKAQTKTDLVVTLLSRPEGVTIEDLMRATGWQAHSVRGAISGSIKSGRGLDVVSQKIDGQRVYRVLVDATT